MPKHLPEVEDLTQEKARDRMLEVRLDSAERALFQAEADKHDVSLEKYVLWRVLTAVAVSEAEKCPLPGNATSGKAYES